MTDWLDVPSLLATLNLGLCNPQLAAYAADIAQLSVARDNQDAIAATLTDPI